MTVSDEPDAQSIANRIVKGIADDLSGLDGAWDSQDHVLRAALMLRWRLHMMSELNKSGVY